MNNFEILPTNDVIFKMIFGDKRHPRILIHFLNSVIRPQSPITSIDIRQTELSKDFETIKETKDIQKCLDNSLKIFTAIYGKDHSFVKDYVAENCKNRSWLYEHSYMNI